MEANWSLFGYLGNKTKKKIKLLCERRFRVIVPVSGPLTTVARYLVTLDLDHADIPSDIDNALKQSSSYRRSGSRILTRRHCSATSRLCSSISPIPLSTWPLTTPPLAFRSDASAGSRTLRISHRTQTIFCSQSAIVVEHVCRPVALARPSSSDGSPRP